MAEAAIPVDLLNPGQVFACLGFMEAAEILLHDAEGRFDWGDDASTSFMLRANGERNPFEAVLEFLAEVEPQRWAPVGYTDPPPKKRKGDDGEGDGDGEDTDQAETMGESPSPDVSMTFPAKEGNRMALPIRFGGGNRPVVELDHWADGSSRESF
jgi:CRISPR-associated protein Csx14